jgi:acyl-coenzyme A thioesterase PaaI-like protein
VSEGQPATGAGQVVGPDQTARDILEASAWRVRDEGPGRLSILAHLPDHLRNRRGELFGGFTPTYVDLVSLYTVRSTRRPDAARRGFMSTVSLRVDYFEPVVGPEFVIQSHIEKQRGRTYFVVVRFLQGTEVAAHATTVMLDKASPQAG